MRGTQPTVAGSGDGGGGPWATGNRQRGKWLEGVKPDINTSWPKCSSSFSTRLTVFKVKKN